MNKSDLPENLPAPSDDGAARHLLGLLLPKVSLPATNGTEVDISVIAGLLVIYIHPMTGRPGMTLPDGWDSIPGARGCTPQACSFRDHFADLRALSASVYGLSAQETEVQQEARERLHLPFNLLSDASLKLKRLMSLPTFKIQGTERYKRLTLIANDGRIERVFYPVFPPDRNIDEVLTWLAERPRECAG